MGPATKKIRYIEVLTGVLLILLVSAMLLAMLSDFSFVTPYSTLQEDMSFLTDNIESLRISALIRLACGILSLILIPFFLKTFSYNTRVYHIVNGALIFLISAYYFTSVWMEFRLISLIGTMPADFRAGNESEFETLILLAVRNLKNLVMAGRMAIGAFLILFTFSRIKAKRIPLASSLMFILSGPSIIFFSWYDPEHIILTVAMAIGATGMMILGLRLINKGLRWLPRRLRRLLESEDA